MKQLKLLDVDSIANIEEYLMNMAALGISLNTLDKLQESATNKGILSEDAMENALTIQFQIQKLLTSMNDQLKICTSQTGVPWKELMDKVVAAIKENSQ